MTLARAAAVGAVLAVVLMLGPGVGRGTPAAFAADPSLTPSAAPGMSAPPGASGPIDPRSDGEGPGLEAEPLLVLAGVVLLGLAAAGGTLLFARVRRPD